MVPPCNAPLHLPALAIPGAGANRPPACGARSPVGYRWAGGLEASPSPLLAEGLAGIGVVRDQLPRPGAGPSTPLRDVDRRQGRHGEGVFRRACTRPLQPERPPWAVGHPPSVRALAALGLVDAAAPFVAGTKRPSRHARAHASWLWAARWLRSARQTRAQGPSAAHGCKRRHQGTAEPSSRGRSSQAPPVWRTYSMPFTVGRSSARGRPGPRRRAGIHGSITAHGSSVSACRLMPLV